MSILQQLQFYLFYLKDGTTTVSVNCDNFYLDWMSDYDISEVYLFAQCKKFNDSQVSMHSCCGVDCCQVYEFIFFFVHFL